MFKTNYLLFITAFCFNVSFIIAAPQCCKNNSYLIKGGCKDGTNITLTCTLKYLINPNIDENKETFNVTKDNSLQAGNSLVPPDQYCLGKFIEDELESAVVCFKEETRFDLLKTISTMISIVFLALTIIVYWMLPTLRDLQGKCILNSLIGLELAYIMLTMVQFINDSNLDFCLFMAFTMYFAFLIAFFWLNVIAFHMWKTTVFSEKEVNVKKTFLCYCLYAYGAPTLLLIITLITHHVNGEHIKPGFGNHSCWFSGIKETWLYFYGPIIVLLIANIIFFIWTSIRLQQDMKKYNEQKMKYLKYRLCLYLKLFFIMGLLWIFEILSYLLMNVHKVLDVIWLITDFINAIQGVLIFIILVVLRKRVLRSLADKQIFGVKFPKSWQTMHDEECVENEEEETQLEMK